MRLWEQPATADQHFVQPCLVPIIDLWANVGALNVRVIFAISMMRSQERTATGVQLFVRPSFVCMIKLCASVWALEHARNFP